MRPARLWLLVVVLGATALTWAGGPPGIGPQPLTSWLHEQEAAARAAAWQRAEAAKDWVPELPPSPIDTLRYALDLHLDCGREVVSGTVEVELEAVEPGLSVVPLDADLGLRIFSVVLLADPERPHDSPAPLPFSHRDDRLTVELPRSLAAGERVTLLISYGGHASAPQPVLQYGYDGPLQAGVIWSSRGSTALSVAFTDAEPFSARVWWPCNDRPDDKAVVELTVTAPEVLVVSSNGLELDRVENADGTATTRWTSAYPIATYLVVMNAADFVFSELPYTTLDGGTMPVVLYAYPELDTQARAVFAVTPEMIGALAEAFGEYPFVEEKYGNCLTSADGPGGMENQTLASIGPWQVGEAHVDWLNVHELAHSWWGDWVTCSDWKDLWLNEGFATYSELVWAEHVSPDLLAQRVEEMDWRGYFLGPVYDCPYAFSSTVYDKGGWILRMLRRVLGDDQFFAGLAAFRAAYGGSSATTADLQTVLEHTTGTDLEWFFQQWVYGQNRPRLRYGWSEVAGPAVRLLVRQEQTNAPLFRMPVDVRVTTVAGVVDAEVWVEAEREQTFDIPLAVAPTNVELDPDHYLLQELGPMEAPDLDFGPLYPDSFDAGAVMVGSNATITVPLTNVGGSDLTVESVTRQSGEDFTLVSSTSFPVTIAPGATVDLEIRYRARGFGDSIGLFYVASNDPSHNGLSHLRVKGSSQLWPDQYLAVPPTSLAFGQVPVGGSSVASFTFANKGGLDLTLSAAVTGEAFELVSAMPDRLPPLTELEVRVRFAPTVVGPATGAFSLTTNDPFVPTVTTALTGEGTAAARLSVEPTALLFGAATAPTDRTLTLTNLGSAGLEVFELLAADPFDLVEPLQLPRSLAPGESATVTVRLTPPANGEVRGVLRILSNDPVLPWASVPLAGRGSSSDPVLQAFPAVARTPGLGGAIWSSDVVLLNPTTQDMALDLTFLPEDTAIPDLSLSLPPGQQRLVADVVDTLGRDGTGGLELAASALGLVATSATFTTATAGTYGQGIPALPHDAALTCGQNLVLVGLAGNGGFHTNLGLLNLGATELSVDFALHAVDGTLLGTRTLVAAPRGFAQATDVLSPLTADTVRGAFAVLTCNDAAAAFHAYASVVDDGSHDPTLVFPVVAGSSPLDVVVPAVAHTYGFGGTQWRSEATVANVGTEAAQIRLDVHYWGGTTTQGLSGVLEAGTAMFLPDLLGHNDGIGWMRVSSDSGSLAVSSRTYNDDPAGSYGQEIPAVPATELLGPGDEAVLPALVEDALHRTNLGIASLAATNTTVRVTVRREDGTPIGDLDVQVPASGVVQLNRVLSSRFGYAGRAWASLSSDEPGARYAAYASVVDEGTGDPVFIPATRLVTTR